LGSRRIVWGSGGVSDSSRPSRLEEYEALARDFAAAHQSDDIEALQRIRDYFQFPRLRSLEELRETVRKRLGARNGRFVE
jgi:hypothetical protein